MVPEVQAPRGRHSFFLILPLSVGKNRSASNYYARRVLVNKEPDSIARRRLCDAKTQITIPGAQLPSSNSKSLPAGAQRLQEISKKRFADLHSFLRWTTIFPCNDDHR